MPPRRETAKAPKPLAVIGSDRAAMSSLFEKIQSDLALFADDPSFAVGKLLVITRNQILMNQDLAQCTTLSICGALMACARVNLYPGPQGTCFIIPRRTGPRLPNSDERAWEAHFQMGYRGWVALGYRSPLVTRLQARVVKQDDVFAYQYGTSDFIEHRPCREATDAALEAAYAIATLKNADSPLFEVMEAHEIVKIRDSQRGTSKSSSPWQTHPDAMWRKCPVTRLVKFLPVDEVTQQAATLDELSLANKSQGLAQEVAALMQDGSFKQLDGALMEELADPQVVDAEPEAETPPNGKEPF